MPPEQRITLDERLHRPPLVLQLLLYGADEQRSCRDCLVPSPQCKRSFLPGARRARIAMAPSEYVTCLWRSPPLISSLLRTLQRS
jgi:hypothetical protein